MKAVCITCRRRTDGKYMVLIADTVGGRNTRQVVSDTPVREGEDVVVKEGKVIG